MRPLRVLYIGKLSEQSDYGSLSKALGPYFVAQQMLESALHEQLAADPEIELTSLSFVLGPTFPNRPLVYRRRSHRPNHHPLPYINTPFLRELSILCALLWFSADATVRGRRPDIIFQLSNYTPVTLGSRIASKLLKAEFVMTLTDLTEFTYRADRVDRMSFIKRLLVGPYRKIAASLERSADAYILFTEEMRRRVGIESAPCLVMEGMFNTDGLEIQTWPSLNRPVIAHAGTLDRQLGISLLLESFARVQDPSAELWLIGSGDMNQEIERQATRDLRIHFFGFQPRPRVYQLLCQARLLINLRDPTEDFTRYSFPSKLFEFLATGVPVASTRLRGIPDAYFRYMIPISSLDPSEIAKAMEAILAEDPASLRERGQLGRHYVIDHKTPKAQSQRVVEFMRDLRNV